MEKGFLRERTEEYFREIQGILALGYVLLVILGMLHDSIYYKAFGINIFEYSEVFDFLIAPFKRIEILVILALALFATWLGYLFDVSIQKRYPRLHNIMNFGIGAKKWFPVYRSVSFFIVMIALVIFYFFQITEVRKNKIFEKGKSELRVIFDSQLKQSMEGINIGANSKYLFLLSTDRSIEIIPLHTNLERIQLLQSDPQ